MKKEAQLPRFLALRCFFQPKNYGLHKLKFIVNTNQRLDIQLRTTSSNAQVLTVQGVDTGDYVALDPETLTEYTPAQ